MKKLLPMSVKQKDICEYIHKNHFRVLWKNNERDALLIAVEEIDRILKYVKKR